MGHVKMMAAVQPFISGAISKPLICLKIALPTIIGGGVQAWKMGVKAIAIYRDGAREPSRSPIAGTGAIGRKAVAAPVAAPARKRLP